MKSLTVSAPIEKFVDYFGELGPRWGLPETPCRLHALLYASARPVPLSAISGSLDLSTTEAGEAVEFLKSFGLVFGSHERGWETAKDPWEMLLAGLAKRSERDLPEALETLESCWREARDDGAVDSTTERQLRKLYEMAEDIAALDFQAQRLSPRALKQLVGVGRTAARMFGRGPAARRRQPPD